MHVMQPKILKRKGNKEKKCLVPIRGYLTDCTSKTPPIYAVLTAAMLYPRKRRHSRRKLSQELKRKIIIFLPDYTHTKIAGCKRETYKMEPRISVPFMLELEYEC